MTHMEEKSPLCPYCQGYLSGIESTLICRDCNAYWSWVDDDGIVYLVQYPIMIG